MSTQLPLLVPTPAGELPASRWAPPSVNTRQPAYEMKARHRLEAKCQMEPNSNAAYLDLAAKRLRQEVLF